MCKDAIILAIESSCDETAAAVVKNGREALSNAVYTQIPLHERFGGVVPEIASRAHVEKLTYVVDLALKDAGVTLDALDAVAVTSGPGLVGALVTGVSYAKALAMAKALPLVSVNHIAGHIAANYISSALVPPFVCLVASGGHTELLLVKDYDEFKLLGATVDDAAGEAFDKVARALGLGYPGGPKLEAFANGGDDTKYAFNSAFNKSKTLNVSFSGIKTAVVSLLNADDGGEIDKSSVAACFQKSVVSALVRKSIHACEMLNMPKLALCGGVSANKCLRDALSGAARARNIDFYMPTLSFCGDNGAMIGAAAYYKLLKGRVAPLTLNADPAARL